MKQLATTLSQGFNYVRVDLYMTKNNIYFGEMTFTSASGVSKYAPQSFDDYLSSKFILPQQAYDIKKGTYYKFPFKYI